MEKEHMASGGGGGVGRNDGRRESGGIIGGFCALDVYKNGHEGMIAIFRQVLPWLPKEEQYDLVDQLRRSSKAIPRLIAEDIPRDIKIRDFKSISMMLMQNQTKLLFPLFKHLATSWEKFHHHKPLNV